MGTKAKVSASFAAAAALAAGLAMAAPQAQANDNLQPGDVGWCAPPAEFSAYMQSQGQRTVFAGDERLYTRGEDGLLKETDRHHAALITMGEDGRAYRVMANKPTTSTEPFDRMCVDLRMENARLFDVRETRTALLRHSAGNGTRPEILFPEGSRAAAEAECEQALRDGEVSVEGACKFLNDSLSAGSGNGAGVVFQASSTYLQDGEWQRGSGVVTVGYVPGGLSVVFASSRTGAT